MSTQPAHIPAALATADLVVPRGATLRVAFSYAEGKPPAKPAGWPDYAHWRARARFAPSWGSNRALATLRRPESIQPRDGDILLDDYEDGTGLITLVVPASVTATWTFSTAVWDLHIRNVDTEEIIRVCEGTARVSAAAGDGADG